MKASRAILTLLAIQLVFFSLLGFSLFGTYLPNYFGNPMSAMNTIFTIFMNMVKIVFIALIGFPK